MTQPTPLSQTPSNPIPAALETLRAIYADLDAEITRRAPVCRLSGRCCRFLEFGHTLFISEIEADLLALEAPAPARPLDAGRSCPWQDAQGRCTARQARPLGCRTYFCDPAYEPTAHEVSEPFITRLKELTREFGLEWNYLPLHQHLNRLRDQGRLSIELAPQA